MHELIMRTCGRRAARTGATLGGIALFFGITPAATAFYEVGDGELFLNLQSSLTYDSNIFARSSQEADWIFQVGPELQFLRQAGLVGVDLRTGIDFGFFADNSELDYESLYSYLDLTYPRAGERRATTTLTLSAREETRTDSTIGARTRSYVYEANGGVRYTVTEKFGTRVRAGYSHVDYRDQERSDIDRYQVRLDGIWVYSPLLEYFGGYRFRYTDVHTLAGEERNNTLDHALIAGLEGEITPKLSGLLEGGYQVRIPEQDTASRREQLTVNGRLNWAVRADTGVFVTAGRDFDTSPERQSLERTDASAGVRQELRQWLQAQALFRYENFRFRRGDNRVDDAYVGQVGLDYDVTTHLFMNVTYSYTVRESTDPEFDYDRHIASVSARWRF